MNMLKRLCASLALAWTIGGSTSALAGEWDGIWVTDAAPGYYFMIRHNDPVMVLVALSVETSDYLYGEAFVGTMAADTALVDVPIFSTAEVFEVFISFHRTAPRTATVTVTDCVPVSACEDLPPGTEFLARRFF